jgi:hypothetical protein
MEVSKRAEDVPSSHLSKAVTHITEEMPNVSADSTAYGWFQFIGLTELVAITKRTIGHCYHAHDRLRHWFELPHRAYVQRSGL